MQVQQRTFPLPPARVCKRCVEPWEQQRLIEEAQVNPDVGRRSLRERERGIYQLLPIPDGWKAIHVFPEAEHEYQLLIGHRLVAWALVRDPDDGERMVGMEQAAGMITRCDDGETFIGYLGPDDDPTDYLETARERWEEIKRGETNEWPAHRAGIFRTEFLLDEEDAPKKLTKSRRRRTPVSRAEPPREQ